MKYSAKMNLFQCFLTPMKLNFNAWSSFAPSNYYSIPPYLVSPERPISILAQTYFSGNTFLDSASAGVGICLANLAKDQIFL